MAFKLGFAAGIYLFKIYFLRRNNNQNPVLHREEREQEALPKYKRDLVQKLKVLRAELKATQPQAGHCRMEISRREIFEVRSDMILFSYKHNFVAALGLFTRWKMFSCLQ